MTIYTYSPRSAVTIAGLLAPIGASGQIFASNDLTQSTPLTLTDANGVQIPNIVVSPLGMLQGFRVDDHPTVVWKSGPYTAMLQADGARIPGGGEAGQILAKASATDFDVAFVDPPTPGTGGGGSTTLTDPEADGLYVIAGDPSGRRIPSVDSTGLLPPGLRGPVNLDVDAGLERKAESVAGTKNGQGFRVGVFTSTTLPDAAAFGVGTQIYNQTTKAPLWSNGTAWVGAPVAEAAIPTGTKRPLYFDYTVSTVARPAVSADTIVIWSGPGPTRPTNMGDSDRWYVEA